MSESLVEERDRLLRWKAEATVIFEGLQDLGGALGLPLGTLVTGPAAVAAAEILRMERDALMAEVEELRGEL